MHTLIHVNICVCFIILRIEYLIVFKTACCFCFSINFILYISCFLLQIWTQMNLVSIRSFFKTRRIFNLWLNKLYCCKNKEFLAFVFVESYFTRLVKWMQNLCISYMDSWILYEKKLYELAFWKMVKKYFII